MIFKLIDNSGCELDFDKIFCRSCGSFNLSLLWKCDKFNENHLKQIDKQNLDSGCLYQCDNCGLGQRIPCLDEDELSAIYSIMPSGTMHYDFNLNAAWKNAKDTLIKLLSDTSQRAILDIGCHEGGFLQELPSRWKCYGIEGGQKPSRIASKKNINIISDRLQTIEKQWFRCFDAVTLFDVLEHLPDPLQGLHTAKALVKPGGFLIISTGNLDAWTWRWFKGSHWYTQTPLHLSFASRQFFDYLTKNLSLEMKCYKEIPHQYGSTLRQSQDHLEAFYFIARQRGGIWRIPQKLLHSLPKLSYLRHKTSVPWTFRLTDHVIVTFQVLVE